MAHDGDDRRTGPHLLGFILHVQFHLLVHLVDGAAAAHALFHFKTEAELGANLAGDLLLHRLVDTGKNPQFHQLLNDLKRLAFEMFGQVADDDGRLERDQFARGGRNNLLRRLGRRGAGAPALDARLRARSLAGGGRDKRASPHGADVAASAIIGASGRPNPPRLRDQLARGGGDNLVRRPGRRGRGRARFGRRFRGGRPLAVELGARRGGRAAAHAAYLAASSKIGSRRRGGSPCGRLFRWRPVDGFGRQLHEANLFPQLGRRWRRRRLGGWRRHDHGWNDDRNRFGHRWRNGDCRAGGADFRRPCFHGRRAWGRRGGRKRNRGFRNRGRFRRFGRFQDRFRRWRRRDFSGGRGRWRWRWRRRQAFGQFFCKILAGNFIERTGGDLGGNAQFLGLGKDLLAFDAKLLCYIVNPNGHSSRFAKSANWATVVSWLQPKNIVASLLITSRYFGAVATGRAPRRLRPGRRHNGLPKTLERLDLLQIGHFHLAQIVQR